MKSFSHMRRLTLVALIAFLLPLTTLAQNPPNNQQPGGPRPIELLEPLPGGVLTIPLGSFPLCPLNKYLQPFMPFAVGMAAGLAVLMIILGGLQIMLSDGNIAQSQGKERVMAALGGLMILVFSATILYILNANYFVFTTPGGAPAC